MYYYIYIVIEENEIVLYLLQEHEGNRCNKYIQYLQASIYSQFDFFMFSYHYTIDELGDEIYAVLTEGRYGEKIKELLDESDLEIKKYYILNKNCSNVENIVNTLNSYNTEHVILHGTEGKCSSEFFKLYGEGKTKLFFSFSHTTPYKIIKSNVIV